MPENKIRVAFCTNGIFPVSVGGMQRHSRLLIDELSTYPDIEIKVLHPHNEEFFSDSPNVTEITIQGMNPEKNYLLERYRYSKRIYQHLKNLKHHVIYSQGPSVWYKASEFSNRLIINPHGLEPFQGITLKDKLIGFPFRLILGRLFKKARHVVSLGGRLTDILESVLTKDKEKIVVLPNAVVPQEIDSHDFNRSFSDPLHILFVGRFAKNKGIHVLMDVIEQLNRDGYEKRITFNLAGKGPLFEDYKSRYSFPNVNFLGFVSDAQLQDLYRESNLFVLPTLFEGMPTVVLEAMSYLLPIIVTDVGATAEQVSDLNGYLITKNNSAQLKKALIDFANLSPEEKKVLGDNSFKKVQERFIWPKVAEAHFKLFNSVQEEL